MMNYQRKGLRKSISLSPSPDGVEYIGFLTIYITIRNVIASRIKDIGTTYSTKVSSHMSMTRCLKHSGTIK